MPGVLVVSTVSTVSTMITMGAMGAMRTVSTKIAVRDMAALFGMFRVPGLRWSWCFTIVHAVLIRVPGVRTRVMLVGLRAPVRAMIVLH